MNPDEPTPAQGEKAAAALPWFRRITVRTVLLSWSGAILSLIVFGGFAFSATKRAFLGNLQAKAMVLAVELNEDALKAKIAGDVTSFDRHCRELLASDNSIAFLAFGNTNNVAVMRSAGVTTAGLESAWAPAMDESGLRPDPDTRNLIFSSTVPMKSNGYAWLNVGLTLHEYYDSMSQVYRSMLATAVACALLALGGAIYYARRLVRPVKELREMVQKVARGDLTARAPHASRDEIGQLASSLNTMTEKLQHAHDEMLAAKELAEAASDAKSRFLATVSHEIRTPINGVIGMLKLIKDSPLDIRQSAQVNTAITSARALLSVIEGILDFSKIEAGKIELECIDFNLGQVVDSAVMMFNERAAEKQLTLAKKIGSGVPEYLQGDPSRISQVLINLVSNALKFTSQGGVTVTVSLQSKAEDRVRLHFAVADTGIGISKEQQGRLFKAFTQADSSTTRKYGGTGLGLAICKQLVELMGGDINIKSEAGAGTTFWFVLPFQIGAAPPVSTEEPASETTAARDGSAPPKASILVVEDNNINAYVARELLIRSGYACDVVVNGEEAVRAFSVKDYDLILMDIQMPIMDGYEATKAIREKERHRPEQRMPIVALTANALTGEKERCVAAGMDDYLAKPLDPELMTRTIQRLLRPNRKAAPGLIGREPVNYPELVERCMKDEKLAHQLLDEFIGQAASTVIELRNHLAAGNRDAIHRVAHRLKGTAATLACEHVRRNAILLESISHDETLLQRGPELLAELESHVRDIANWRDIRKEKELL